MVAKKPKLEKFRVWVSQVNQCMVEVDASDEQEARVKGYAKWRRYYAFSHVSYVEKVEK